MNVAQYKDNLVVNKKSLTNSGFDKMRGTSCLADKLAACQG